MNEPILFLIPARGGSRRVVGKNLRTVAGIPLVGHAVRAARRAARSLAGGPHAVVCSTDDVEIARTASSWGATVPFVRPTELATDQASSVDVAIHALDELGAAGPRYRALVLVQPTSPLTDPADIRAAVARFDETGGRPVVSVTYSHPSGWHAREGDGLEPVTAGDGLERIAAGDARLLLTGAFYVIAPDELRERRAFIVPGRTVGHAVPAERSIDVDEEADLAVAEALADARPIRPVPLGERLIGMGPCFVIAEAGVNHDGDPALAHRLVDAAADARADAVKFQTFDPDALAAADAPLADYQRAAGETAASQRAMLERLALPAEGWPGLREHAVERGLVFLSTPFDERSADLLQKLGVVAWKVASGELTNHPFLARLAGTGLPLLVSTGMADIREVADAVDAITDAGDPPIALFHCVSSYPADPADANLRAMRTLRAAFGVPTGWSDHTLGIELPTAAAALGASILEKHLTLDRGLPGPDHRASLEPAEFATMVRAVRAVEASLGSGAKAPAASERSTAAVARKSLHWAHDLVPGRGVEPGDLVARRPGTGIPPYVAAELVGRRTARAVIAGEIVRLDDLEPGE